MPLPASLLIQKDHQPPPAPAPHLSCNTPNHPSPNHVQLCEDEQVKAMIQKSLSEEARVAKLKGFEQVADIVLTPVPFSVETGTMTPTFKLKRPQLREAYAPALEAMYARLPM